MKQLLQGLLKGQDGAIGMLIISGFMAPSIPIITSAVGLAGTFATDSQLKTRIAKSQYSAIAVAEYVRYLSCDPK